MFPTSENVTAEPVPQPQSRLIVLDLLRLLAVLLVMGHHFTPAPEELSMWLYLPFYWLGNHGGVGVDLFFVLSGFLVGGLLLAEHRRYGSFSLKRFYVRRAWRIYPPFYVLLLVTYFATKYGGLGWDSSRIQRVSEVFFLQSYVPGYWNHTWTLAVEEHFYILLPLALLALVRLDRRAPADDPYRSLPWLVAGVMLICTFLRVANYSLREEYSLLTHVFPTHLRADALLFGVGIAYFFHFHRAAFYRRLKQWRILLLAVGIVFMSTELIDYFAGHAYRHTVGIMQTYLACAALMLGAMMCRPAETPLVRGLAKLGTYSYSIYLWHMAVMWWLVPVLEKQGFSWGMQALCYTVACLILGIVMAWLVEEPLMRLRNRLHPARVGALDAKRTESKSTASGSSHDRDSDQAAPEGQPIAA